MHVNLQIGNDKEDEPELEDNELMVYGQNKLQEEIKCALSIPQDRRRLIDKILIEQECKNNYGHRDDMDAQVTADGLIKVEEIIAENYDRQNSYFVWI